MRLLLILSCLLMSACSAERYHKKCYSGGKLIFEDTITIKPWGMSYIATNSKGKQFHAGGDCVSEEVN